MILGFSGSPFPDGNTDRIVKALLEGSGKPYQFVNLSKLKFDPCRACAHLCASTNICPIGDDLKTFFEPIRDAEALVFGTPVHAGLITGWMFSFLTRFSCYSHVRRPLEGKPAVTVVTGCFKGTEDRVVPEFNNIVKRQTRGADVVASVFHHTSIPPCFKCGEGNECMVGGLWSMVGRDEQKLRDFKVTPESFTRWEDSRDTMGKVSRIGGLLAEL